MMKECLRRGSAGSRWTLRKRENELVAASVGPPTTAPHWSRSVHKLRGEIPTVLFRPRAISSTKIGHCAELGRRPSEGESAFPIVRFLDRVRRTRNRNQ